MYNSPILYMICDIALTATSSSSVVFSLGNSEKFVELPSILDCLM